MLFTFHGQPVVELIIFSEPGKSASPCVFPLAVLDESLCIPNHDKRLACSGQEHV